VSCCSLSSRLCLSVFAQRRVQLQWVSALVEVVTAASGSGRVGTPVGVDVHDKKVRSQQDVLALTHTTECMFADSHHLCCALFLIATLSIHIECPLQV
jgi:hypothetical protein